MSKVVVVLSGGFDSGILTFYAVHQGHEVYAITFDYGQKCRKEIEAAEKIGRLAGVKDHKFIQVDLKSIGGSSLTVDTMDIPDEESTDSIFEHGLDVTTYVPSRNTIFLSIAAAYAEVVGAESVYYGALKDDYLLAPDCGVDYINAFNEVLKVGTNAGIHGNTIKVEAPFIVYDKKDVAKIALKLGIPFEITWSCFRNGDEPCGKCESCILKEEAIREARAELDAERTS